MRLVISVVKKFASPQFPFDDLLSEGIVSLMHAVEKFDFDRGFRFSTYAYRSIARNAYRKTMDRQRDNARFATGSDDSLLAAEDRNQWSSLDEHGWTQLRSLVKTFVGQLDRRERFIIRGRFALGSHQKIRTFQCLAEKLGVSKERVRQIEQRAISKMRVMAAEALKDEAIVPTI
jgi:RNA polymerase primary sigma factor